MVQREIDDLLVYLKRNNVDIVGISATDQRDKIYLAGLIRDALPKAKVYVTGTSLLFAHENYRTPMRGVYIAGEYPLFPRNHEKSGHAKPITFKSHVEEGAYNATMALRKKDAMLRDYLPKGVGTTARDYRDRRPGIWITTVGEMGRFTLWACFENYDSKIVYAPEPGGKNEPPDPKAVSKGPICPAGFVHFQWAGAITGLAFAAAWFWVLRKHSGGWADSSAGPKVTDRWFEDVALTLAWLSICAGSVIWIKPLLAMVVIRYDMTPAQWFVSLSILVGSVVLGLVALVRGIQAANRAYRPDFWVESVLFWIVSVVIGTYTFVMCLSPPGGVVWEKSLKLLLFVERIEAIQSGYSILLPVLFGVAGIFTATSTALVIAADARRRPLRKTFPLFPDLRPRVPEPAGEPSVDNALRQIRTECEDVDQFLRNPTTKMRPWSILLATAVTAVGIVTYQQSRATMEGLIWDAFLFILVLSVHGLAVFLGWQLFKAWKDISQMLWRVNALPLAGSFGRIPGPIAASFGGFLYAFRPRSAELLQAVHLLRQVKTTADVAADPIPVLLIRTEPARRPALRPRRVYDGSVSVDVIPTAIATRLSRYKFDTLPDTSTSSRESAEDSESGTRQYDKSLKSLALEARRLTVQLSGYWHQYPASAAFGTEPGGDSNGGGKDTTGGEAEKAAAGTPNWVSRAEEFVAAIFVLYLARLAWRLRRLAYGLMITAVFATLAVTSYPFEPEALALYVSGFLTLLAAAGVGIVLVSANRNPIISRITRTTPYRFNLTWAFVHNTFLLILAPGLFIAAQMSGRLRAVVGPLLDVIR
jgi:hypothetical protein